MASTKKTKEVKEAEVVTPEPTIRELEDRLNTLAQSFAELQKDYSDLYQWATNANKLISSIGHVDAAAMLAVETLNRQKLLFTAEIGKFKPEALKDSADRINSFYQVLKVEREKELKRLQDDMEREKGSTDDDSNEPTSL